MKVIPYLFVFLVLGCSKQEPAKTLENHEKPATKSFRYLALGDSYTIGTAIGVDKAYPSLVLDSLKRKYPSDSIELKIIAQNGWTTNALQNALNADIDTNLYDAVSLLIGVNDQFSGKSLHSYKTGLLQNIKSALAYVKQDTGRLILISIPDYGVTPYGNRNNGTEISKSIDQFNAVNKQIADSLYIAYVNITDVSRLAQNQSNLVASDGLHFSALMHQLWLPLVYQQLVVNYPQ